jgi:hypothetical protein
MQSVKRLLAQHARLRLDAELEDAIEVNAQQRSAEDFKEGVDAFLERRRADWPSMKVKVSKSPANRPAFPCFPHASRKGFRILAVISVTAQSRPGLRS